MSVYMNHEELAELRREQSRAANEQRNEELRRESEAAAAKLREKAWNHNPVGYAGGPPASSIRLQVAINGKRGLSTLIKPEQAAELSEAVDATAVASQFVTKYGRDAVRYMYQNRDSLRAELREQTAGKAIFFAGDIPGEVQSCLVDLLNSR